MSELIVLTFVQVVDVENEGAESGKDFDGASSRSNGICVRLGEDSERNRKDNSTTATTTRRSVRLGEGRNRKLEIISQR